jgi:PhoH-like ATPase
MTGQHMQTLKEEAFSEEEHHENNRKKKGKKRGDSKKGKRDRSPFHSVDDLVYQGSLSLEAITYMRGRSIPYQFILIDEVQNLSPHEAKTIISRVGQGSKIVLCGDPYQIDSPYLDFSSNGLVVASDKFKDQSLFATVFLENSERSQLSQLAGELM